jgi:large conductance mechanosensitive channel
MKKMLEEFKDFVARGNVMDLAIGVIIGGAFSTVVKSLVDNLLMPPFGALLGNVDFSDLFVVLKGADVLPTNATLQMARDAGAVVWAYGAFLSDVISFLLLALGVFFLIKAFDKLQKAAQKPEEVQEEAPVEKECPYCMKQIPVNATRCPHCTSTLD